MPEADTMAAAMAAAAEERMKIKKKRDAENLRL
jgi:hypothetical protein